MADEQDEQDAGEQPETHYRASAKALTVAELYDLDLWAEVAAFFVAMGVRPTVAWQRANEWCDERPGEWPEGLVLPEPTRSKTLPPPAFLAKVAPLPVDAIALGSEPSGLTIEPGKRRCLYCGQHKPFPDGFKTRGPARTGRRGPGWRISPQKCAQCTADHPGDRTPKFKPDPIPPGPRRCRFCLEVKVYPADFRYPGRPNQINRRKCTACGELGTGDALDAALEQRRGDGNDDVLDAEQPMALPVVQPAPVLMPEVLPAGVVSLSMQRRLAVQREAPEPPLGFLPLAAVLTEVPTPAAEPARLPRRPSAPPVTMIARAPKARVAREPNHARKDTTMSSTRETITKCLTKSGCTVAELVAATAMSEQTLGNELRAMRLEGIAKKAAGYGTPWELTAKGAKGVAAKGPTKTNGNGHRSAAGDVTIGAPPLTAEQTTDPFLVSLLKKRADIVTAAQSQVQKIDDLLAAWAS